MIWHLYNRNTTNVDIYFVKAFLVQHFIIYNISKQKHSLQN